MRNIISILISGLLVLILSGCPSPSSNSNSGSSTSTTTSSTGIRSGRLSLIPVTSGTGSASRSLAAESVSLSVADQARVSQLASSGLKNYTQSLLSSEVETTNRAVTPINAGNALGSLTIGSSGYVNFIVQNTGNAPLYNVIFTVSDGISSGDFSLAPGLLTTLNTSGSSSFEPLITLNIQHGNLIANGEPVAGQYNYLPYTIPASANVTATVTIYAWNEADGATEADGVTTANYSNNATADNELIATLKVTVQTAAWEVDTDGTQGIPIALNTNTNAGGVYGLGDGIHHDTTPYLKNAGNVPLLVTYMTVDGSGAFASWSSSTSLAPGSGETLSYSPSGAAMFYLDTQGVVYNWRITTVNGVGKAIFWQSGTSQTGNFYIY